MENQTKERKNVNYAVKIVGYLGHDNKLFDRTCPACGGMYSSQTTPACPKCNQPLTFLTNSEGKALSISEGTIYPAFGPKQEKRDADAVAKRKNGMVPLYRFKMFEFMDEHGVLSPPPFHSRCLKGAKVEIVSMNHQMVPSRFKTKDGNVKVELMIQIYTNYGDTFKVLTEAQYDRNTVSYSVNSDGSPAPINTEDKDRIAQLEAEIASLKGVKAPPEPPVQDDVSQDAWNNEAQLDAAASVVNNTNIDPFIHAK